MESMYIFETVLIVSLPLYLLMFCDHLKEMWQISLVLSEDKRQPFPHVVSLLCSILQQESRKFTHFFDTFYYFHTKLDTLGHLVAQYIKLASSKNVYIIFTQNASWLLYICDMPMGKL